MCVQYTADNVVVDENITHNIITSGSKPVLIASIKLGHTHGTQRVSIDSFNLFVALPGRLSRYVGFKYFNLYSYSACMQLDLNSCSGQ